MIQEIFPKVFNNEFKNINPKNNDYVIIFDKYNFYLDKNENFVKYKDILDSKCVFIFSIDDKNYFLSEKIKDDFIAYKINTIRGIKEKLKVFILITAYQIYSWINENKFCGICGNKNILSIDTRSITCSNCNNIIYPKISPAVIVLIKDNNKVLLTKYKTGYSKYALVAGYCEIGETIEETIIREVKEEVGLNIKNIKYYKSQPWSFSSSLLLGFICDVDGVNKVKIDENELKEAKWFNKEDVEEQSEGLSLTEDMINAFKNGII